jgi:flagellar M-ring protein FliF
VDTLKQQLLRIQQQLGGLSASQKMLTASLVAIMVMTMLWWARYAGTAEMQPLLDQALNAEELSRIKNELSMRGVPYSVTGDRLLVPADRRFEALADLSYQQLLPQDTRSGFDEMFARTGMFESQSRTDLAMNRAKEMDLSRVIGRYPGVRGAAVTLDAKPQRRIGSDVKPTAAVSVQMKSGQQPSKQLVEAIAAYVAGSTAGLKRSDVNVIIDGRPHRVRDAQEDPLASGGDILEMLQGHEHRLENKIRDHYAAIIPGLAATVTVELDASNRQKQSRIYDAKNTVSKEIETDSETEESTSGAAPSGEPGVGSNVGADITGVSVAATPTSTVRERSNSRFQVLPSVTDETITTPAGLAKPVAASVSIPHSYFVSIWRAQNPSASTEPDEATIKPIVEAHLAEIRLQVMKMTGIPVTDDVIVSAYRDAPVSEAVAEAGTGAAVGMLLSGNVKEIAVGALAVISLFMVSMMVRRSAPPLPVPVAAPEPVVPATAFGDPVAGEVGAGLNALSGQELDDEQVESHQMIEQVETMVRENPDAAAQLVKRWLNRS